MMIMNCIIINCLLYIFVNYYYIEDICKKGKVRCIVF